MITYAWIIATISSRMLRAIIVGIDNNMFLYVMREKFDRREINKCPATIFAESRTARVIGRIVFLTSSIITIKFIRGVGVPMGVM